jgi:adenylate cyclase
LPRQRAVASPAALRTTSFAGDRALALAQRMRERGLAREGLAAQIFPEMSVLSIRFTDHLTLAQRIGEAASKALFDQLACHIEQVAAQRGVDYLKVLGDQVMAAEGFEAGDHATIMAEIALAAQEEGARLFSELDQRAAFRIGLDTGGVIGSPVGEGERTYNLWGEAVRTALTMSETGPVGGIHVTESAYQRLRDRYLFRVRGSFYLERVGEMSTYLLIGRL